MYQIGDDGKFLFQKMSKSLPTSAMHENIAGIEITLLLEKKKNYKRWVKYINQPVEVIGKKPVQAGPSQLCKREAHVVHATIMLWLC